MSRDRVRSPALAQGLKTQTHVRIGRPVESPQEVPLAEQRGQVAAQYRKLFLLRPHQHVAKARVYAESGDAAAVLGEKEVDELVFLDKMLPYARSLP